MEESANLIQAEADAVVNDIKIKLRPQLQQLGTDGEETINTVQDMSKLFIFLFLLFKIKFYHL